jgi:hypothetical protein
VPPFQWHNPARSRASTSICLITPSGIDPHSLASINMTSDDLIDLGMKSCDAAHRKPVAEINRRQCNSSQS